MAESTLSQPLSRVFMLMSFVCAKGDVCSTQTMVDEVVVIYSPVVSAGSNQSVALEGEHKSGAPDQLRRYAVHLPSLRWMCYKL